MAGQRHAERAGPEGSRAGGTQVSADLTAAGMFSETEQKGKNGTGSTANFCGNGKKKGELANLGMNRGVAGLVRDTEQQVLQHLGGTLSWP